MEDGLTNSSLHVMEQLLEKFLPSLARDRLEARIAELKQRIEAEEEDGKIK